MSPAVSSSISPFHISDAPWPTVPVSDAPKAAAEPVSATAPTSVVHRRDNGDVRRASSSTATNNKTCRSATTFRLKDEIR
jgi:hypothetical protein